MKDSESNSRRQAVALAYQDGDAPRILARGYGDLAERIIAEARRQDVFVHDAPELVGLLMQLDLDHRTPVRLYQLIAELLVWLQAMNAKDESVRS